ncbi:MAG: hypothetical protein HXN24_05500 [Porphyromonas sp.]|nr:hypothetical protein [Porphyromonas sp.]
MGKEAYSNALLPNAELTALFSTFRLSYLTLPSYQSLTTSIFHEAS